MTIELLAAAPDGWGLFRSAEGYWLLRPPFRTEHRFRVTLAQLERAIADEGFVLQSETFENWGAAVRFLEAHVVAAAMPGELQSAREAADRLLGYATAEQAARHLDRLQVEIDAGRGATAVRALRALLGGAHVKADPALVSRIATMLEQASVVAPVFRNLRIAQQTWAVKNEAGVRELSAALAERGQVLAPAA